MEMPDITLEPVRDDDLPAFKQRLRDAFTLAAREAFPDFPEVIPPERDIDESLHAAGAEALQIVCGGEPVGGAIVSGDGESMLLDFIFIDPAHQDRHLGYAAWCAIEARYPEAVTWELVTPYHEQRNIHFYVNRCGFCITEYYNDRHRDPNYPAEEAGDYPGEDGGLFKFVKYVWDPGDYDPDDYYEDDFEDDGEPASAGGDDHDSALDPAAAPRPGEPGFDNRSDEIWAGLELDFLDEPGAEPASAWAINAEGDFELREPYATQLTEARMAATAAWRDAFIGYLEPRSSYSRTELEDALTAYITRGDLPPSEIVSTFVVGALTGELSV